MRKALSFGLIALMLSGCSLFSRAPGPDLADTWQENPPWEMAEEPVPPHWPPPCEMGQTDARDRITLSTGWSEQTLPLADCHVYVPVVKDWVTLGLYGKYIRSEYRAHLPEGRFGSGYGIDLELEPGAILPVRIASAGPDGADIVYTVVGVADGYYQVEVGPTPQGPWRPVKMGELIDPKSRVLRLTLPRPTKAPDVSQLLKRFTDYAPVNAQFTWSDQQTLLAQVAEGEVGIAFGELLDRHGFPIRSDIGSIYFSEPARLVRVTPSQAQERTIAEFTMVPHFHMTVSDHGVYYDDYGQVWRIDLATGERALSAWPEGSPWGRVQPGYRQDYLAWWDNRRSAPGGMVRADLVLTIDGETTVIPSTAGVGQDGNPWGGGAVSFSPDYATLAFADIVDDGRTDLVLLDVKRLTRRTLVSLDVPWQQAMIWQAYWSPGGSQIVLGPHLIDVATGRVLTTAPAAGAPVWSANNRYLLLQTYHMGDDGHGYGYRYFGSELALLDAHTLRWLDLGVARFVDFLPGGDLLLLRWPEGSNYR